MVLSFVLDRSSSSCLVRSSSQKGFFVRPFPSSCLSLSTRCRVVTICGNSLRAGHSVIQRHVPLTDICATTFKCVCQLRPSVSCNLPFCRPLAVCLSWSIDSYDQDPCDGHETPETTLTDIEPEENTRDNGSVSDISVTASVPCHFRRWLVDHLTDMKHQRTPQTDGHETSETVTDTGQKKTLVTKELTCRLIC